jgi:hypothetical protein
VLLPPVLHLDVTGQFNVEGAGYLVDWVSIIGVLESVLVLLLIESLLEYSI